jgi:lysozyme
MRTIGTKGIDLIVSFEKEVLHVYDDGFSYPTVGVGHLLTADEKLAMPLGTRITKEQSREFFKNDLKKYIDAVNKAVTAQITQNQFDALVSLCFNIGIGAFNKSTLVKKLNSGNYAGAADGFLVWNKVKGDPVKGLTRRRTAERALFLTPDLAAPSATTTATPITPTEIEPTVSPIVSKEQTVEATKDNVTTSTTTSGVLPGTSPNDAPVQVSRNGLLSKITALVGGMGGIGTAIWGFLSANPSVGVVGVVCVTILILAIIYRGTIIDLLRMETASNPNKYNVK